MRRLTVRLAIASLTFIVGVAAASLWIISRLPATEGVPVANIPAPLTPAEVKRTYKSGMHAEGISEDGHPACFGTVESSDGATFPWQRTTYKSSRRANGELNKMLEKAVEIIKREPLFDKGGKQLGEEVIATFAPSGGQARLLWTNGADFGHVSNSSLENILAYEKDHGR